MLENALEKARRVVSVATRFGMKVGPWAFVTFLDGRADDDELAALGPLLEESILEETGEAVEVIIRRKPVRNLDEE